MEPPTDWPRVAEAFEGERQAWMRYASTVRTWLDDLTSRLDRDAALSEGERTLLAEYATPEELTWYVELVERAASQLGRELARLDLGRALTTVSLGPWPNARAMDYRAARLPWWFSDRPDHLLRPYAVSSDERRRTIHDAFLDDLEDLSDEDALRRSAQLTNERIASFRTYLDTSSPPWPTGLDLRA